MKLVVGLGNPGRKYEATRHNLGYAVLAELARRLQIRSYKEKFSGELAEANFEGEKLLLLSPATYMNNSGTSVRAARDFYGLSNEEILVICDDLNLPVGRLRLRSGGSSGGQKGLDDIIRKVGSEEFPRLRIGIGPAPEDWDAVNYVLARFTREELPEIERAVAKAAEAVLMWAREGIHACMTRYNPA
jgi:peptidyl-tRNA hydrolase, PTH1 family